MKKIILIEDDPAIRDVFSLALDQKQYEVMAYETGKDILSDKVDPPDIFVIDKNISSVSGLDICRHIRNSDKYRSIPVLMLSASPDIRESAKQAGADDAISKPFTLTTLRGMIFKYTNL